MTGPGWTLLAVAVLVVPTGTSFEAERVRSHRWAGRRRREPDVDAGLALTLDLVAAALRAGRPLADALDVAAPAAAAGTAAVLRKVAGLLRLGADPAQAWSVVPRASPLAEVGAAAVRSAQSGARLADGFERLAGDLRARRAAHGLARAARAGVLSMGPLAACFLPSFVCLGIVPVVVGVARSAIRLPS